MNPPIQAAIKGNDAKTRWNHSNKSNAADRAAIFSPRVQLLIIALLIGTLPLIVASIILPLRMEATLTAAGHAQLSQVAENLVLLTQRELEQKVETVRSLASVDALREAFHRREKGTLDPSGLAATNRQLGALLRQLGDHNQGVFMCDSTGEVFAGTFKTGETKQYEALNVKDRAYFTHIRHTLQPVISDPIRSKIGNVPIVVVAVPILNTDGSLAGMLGLSIEVEYFTNIISGHKIGKTGYPFAIDRFGGLFAHPDPNRVFNDNLLSVQSTRHLAERMIRGETGVEDYISSKGTNKLAAFTPIPNTGWSIAASIETDEFAAPARHLRWIIFSMIGACIVVAMLVATTFTVGLAKLKQALAITRHNEAELDIIHNNVPTMMLLLNRDGIIRRANRAARHFAGSEENAIVGLKDGELFGCIHVMDDQRGCGFGPECANCTLRQAVINTACEGTSHTQIESTLRLIRGGSTTEYVLRSSTARIEHDGDHMVLVCLEDVTEQKQAEARIREQAALLDVTRDAIYVLDLDGVFIFWNRGAESIYGWKSEEVIGQKLGDIFAKNFVSNTFNQAKEAIWTQGSWSGEFQQGSRTAQPLTVQCRASLIRDQEGTPRSILVVNTDVTEARKVEAQFLRAQRLDSLGALASGVAHDLNNVLSPILMAVELLRPVAVSPEDSETLRVISESASRGADVVRQLLLFGRGSNGPRIKVSVATLLSELMRISKGSFPKNITVLSNVAEDLKQVLADPTQIYQVFLNLFMNARDAMPEGGQLMISAENTLLDMAFVNTQPGAKAGPHLVVTVTDSGSGIPTEILDKIFDPFFTTKAEGHGTGLGLSTVLGIVRSHGGFVTVKTQLGKGSEFSVYLPATDAEENETPTGIDMSLTNGNGELILIVDDEPPIRAILRRILESANYRVIQARDGIEALKLYQAQVSEIQAIISDLIMPGMDGIQSIRRFQKLDHEIPIIALSGSDSWRSKLIEEGFPGVEFISKPFSPQTLLHTLKKSLNGQQSNKSKPAKV